MKTVKDQEKSENCFLECKICHKQFPKYDQRGFRNAGFTAHQNRCIERIANGAAAAEKQQKPKYRLLLPAPPPQQQLVSQQPPSPSSPLPDSLCSIPIQQQPDMMMQSPQSYADNMPSYAYQEQDASFFIMIHLLHSQPMFQCSHCTPDQYGFHEPCCIAFIPSPSQ
ncbi:MAG: hypothetical protein EXX96DRAFT_646107 [Benjaminiella poitrasii]|nr:MAG: hypothetical protein EXX96DRAFT_646107 [Benjaminiella poitrasii]